MACDHSKLPLTHKSHGTEAAQKCKVWRQSPIWLNVFKNGPHAEEAALADPFSADRWTARTSADTVLFYFCPTLNKSWMETGLSFKGRTTRKQVWHAHKAKVAALSEVLCWDSCVVRSHDLKLLLKIRVFSRWRHPQKFGLCQCVTV